MKSTILAACFTVAAATAHATTIDFGPTSSTTSGANISFDNLVTPTSIIGDATFTFSTRGDLDHVSEYVDVSIDGFSLGRVFDNNSSNDDFDFAGDSGTQSSSTHTGSATISNAVFASLISDGFLNLLFDYSAGVNCCGTVQLLSGSITFTSGVAPVPLPATAGMLGLGLFGLGAMRRRKQKQTA
ncbi:hypothetical protein RSK20926_14324 [Roseobacter sp. SK209-2-6]|uniref:VPLPA-CTERM sorting domain-containing protein n=1 Tax=Roseobacter sp. SK209-2-6 TaxID=388739 RepID=UPI0000F3D4D8|nr:VPLPA-CTERM sorting domain-containing protein [Roseobacter sp. SK209-2-6]EBA15814.1 hypothetical protein RSK20926_14324 [Roseobacter sp. SK209-2-6]